jgi:hypothetical protein
VCIYIQTIQKPLLYLQKVFIRIYFIYFLASFGRCQLKPWTWSSTFGFTLVFVGEGEPSCIGLEMWWTCADWRLVLFLHGHVINYTLVFSNRQGASPTKQQQLTNSVGESTVIFLTPHAFLLLLLFFVCSIFFVLYFFFFSFFSPHFFLCFWTLHVFFSKIVFFFFFYSFLFVFFFSKLSLSIFF